MKFNIAALPDWAVKLAKHYERVGIDKQPKCDEPHCDEPQNTRKIAIWLSIYKKPEDFKAWFEFNLLFCSDACKERAQQSLNQYEQRR